MFTFLFLCPPAGIRYQDDMASCHVFQQCLCSLLIHLVPLLHLISHHVPLPSSSSKQRDAIQPPTPLCLIPSLPLRTDPSITKPRFDPYMIGRGIHRLGLSHLLLSLRSLLHSSKAPVLKSLSSSLSHSNELVLLCPLSLHFFCPSPLSLFLWGLC